MYVHLDLILSNLAHHYHREKYVTRAEYDELKTRFDEVSAKVDRLHHLYGSFFHTGMPPGPPGTSPEAMSTYGGSAEADACQ